MSGTRRRPPTGGRWSSVAVGLLLLLAAGAGLSLSVVFLLRGPTPLQGLLLAVAFGALAAGVVLWSHRLLPETEYVERRHRLASDDGAARAVAATLTTQEGVSRRTILRWLLLGAGAGILAALAAPVLALGPNPGRARFSTPWRRGLRLVDEKGTPLRAADVPMDGIRTVFPEGAVGSPLGQAVVVRVDPARLRLPAERLAWAPDGLVVYSKVCTHAGCPVGLYRAETGTLVCPCHQSTFQVLEGATPAFGPAARPLPQLPVQLAADGTLVALGDFPEPVGPSFWDITDGSRT